MARVPSPFDYMGPAILMGQMMAEAQVVIGLRVLGMMGAIPAARGEKRRMVTEKAAALKEAGRGVTRAMLSGAPGHDIAVAAMKPLRRRTRANVRRLTKGGGKG